MADERDAGDARESDGFSRSDVAEEVAELVVVSIARGIWGLGALIVGVFKD